MKVLEFSQKLGLKVLTGETGLEGEINGVYVGDLLSWVMSHADKGNAWITVLTHLNVVAVALLTEVSCIIIPEGIQVEEPSILKAQKEGIVILSSDKTTYELCFKAHEVGI